MDAKKFGAFIAAVRKERCMTQMDLAEKLHVTDKAVGKWERGLGFPDIKTIAPLADALGVSILEIMQSERIETEIAPDAVSAALTDTFELAKQQRKAERKKFLLFYDLLAVFFCCVLIGSRFAPLHEPVQLGISVFVALFGIPRLMIAYSHFKDNEQGRKKFRNIVLRSVFIGVAIVFFVVAVTVLYAINRP